MKDFLDGLDDDDLSIRREEIRASASIVNGGESGLVACPKCRGTGQTRWGACYSCQGKGKRTTRSIAASKGAETAKRNREDGFAEWAQSEVGKWCFANRDWNEFAGKMINTATEYGHLTENQEAAVLRSMAKQAERRAAKLAEKAAAAPKVEMSAIEALFATAKSNGLKDPKFYAGNIRLSLAKPGSANPGAVYVKENGQYAGKIANGIFSASYSASKEVLATVQEIAQDPRGFAIRTGQETVRCCCCGIALTDPVSRENGIGPICAQKWGF